MFKYQLSNYELSWDGEDNWIISKKVVIGENGKGRGRIKPENLGSEKLVPTYYYTSPFMALEKLMTLGLGETDFTNISELNNTLDKLREDILNIGRDVYKDYKDTSRFNYTLKKQEDTEEIIVKPEYTGKPRGRKPGSKVVSATKNIENKIKRKYTRRK